MNNKNNAAFTGILLTIVSLQTNISHAEGIFSLTSGLDYSSGKYGQSEATQITYIPFVAKYEMDNTTLKLTVPWVSITGPGDVVGGNNPIVLGKSNRPVTTQEGLGDIVISATQTIAKMGDTHPLILDLTGKVKLATASSSKNLGTGENDYTVAMDAYKSINNNLTFFGGVGYKLMGDPAGINLNNVWFSSAGLSYKINPSSSVGVMADARQATSNTSTALRELTVFLTHKYDAHYKLQSYITHGYSDASTDWGGGVMLSRLF